MNAELSAAVSALIDPTKVHLARDGGAGWQQVPSLWSMLEDASQCRSGNGGTSRGSRPVISTAVVALVILVGEASTQCAVELTGKTRGNTPANLRCIAANLHDAEQIGWWTDKVRQWALEARTHLRLDPPMSRSIRGAQCPRCGASTVRVRQEDQTVRMPALQITWHVNDDAEYHQDEDWQVRAVECRNCKVAWVRGDMDALIDQVLGVGNSGAELRSLTRETMTDRA